jgi:hypothetical protein
LYYYTRNNLTSCNKFVNKPSTSCLVTSCQQVWNKLLTICNNLVDIIRLVTRLFQQVRYSHDIPVFLQPCVVNLVTFLFFITVSNLLEQPCDKSDKGRTIRKVMRGGGGGGLGGQNQKKIYSQKRIREKNLPRHSAKKKFLAWKIGL